MAGVVALSARLAPSASATMTISLSKADQWGRGQATSRIEPGSRGRRSSACSRRNTGTARPSESPRGRQGQDPPRSPCRWRRRILLIAPAQGMRGMDVEPRFRAGGTNSSRNRCRMSSRIDHALDDQICRPLHVTTLADHAHLPASPAPPCRGRSSPIPRWADAAHLCVRA